jgi:hypothetical protein
MTRVFTLLFVFVTPVAAMAQSSVCSEQTIRDAVQNKTMKAADDEFFWSGRYDKPLIGKAEHEEAAKKAEVDNPRKNQVSAQHPQRIVVSKSGDMAYEYGTGDLSFDDQKTGKHVAGQTGYLRVWKSVDGQCRVTATMMRPIETPMKSN